MTIFDRLMQQQYDVWGIHPPAHDWCSDHSTQLEVAFLKHTLQLQRAHRILDLLCSWGRHAIALASQGYAVTGLDASASMIAQARQRAAATACDASFIEADVKDMRFERPFDVVYSVQASPFEAWRSLEDIIGILQCVRRVLRPGGQYLFGWGTNWNRADVAAPRWKEELRRAGITEYAGRDLPFTLYGIKEQTELARQAGFRVTGAHNDYADSTAAYDEARPGLVLRVEKRAQRSSADGPTKVGRAGTPNSRGT